EVPGPRAVRDLRVAALGLAAGLVLRRPPPLALPLPVGDASLRLPRQVDARRAAEAESGGGLDERVAVVRPVETALGTPHVLGDPVEDRVTGDGDRPAPRDPSVGPGLEVAEGAVADPVRGGALHRLVEVGPRRGRAGQGDHLERRRRGLGQPGHPVPARTAPGRETTLKVEAGGWATPVTRSTSGLPSLPVRRSYSSWSTPSDQTEGSYVGRLAEATTPPSRRSSTTAAAVSAGCPSSRAARTPSVSACSVARWIGTSRVVTRSSPGTGSVRESSSTATPRASTRTSRRPGVPRRSSSYCCSSPAAPTRSPSAMAPSDAATVSASG